MSLTTQPCRPHGRGRKAASLLPRLGRFCSLSLSDGEGSWSRGRKSRVVFARRSRSSASLSTGHSVRVRPDRPNLHSRHKPPTRAPGAGTSSLGSLSINPGRQKTEKSAHRRRSGGPKNPLSGAADKGIFQKFTKGTCSGGGGPISFRLTRTANGWFTSNRPPISAEFGEDNSRLPSQFFSSSGLLTECCSSRTMRDPLEACFDESILFGSRPATRWRRIDL